MDKEFCIKRYLKLKKTLGRKPKYREFLDNESINKRQLERTFGSN